MNCAHLTDKDSWILYDGYGMPLRRVCVYNSETLLRVVKRKARTEFSDLIQSNEDVNVIALGIVCAHLSDMLQSAHVFSLESRRRNIVNLLKPYLYYDEKNGEG